MIQVHKFFSKPSRTEIFQIWNAAKRLGEIPNSWSFAKRGGIEQVWGGWILTAK